MRFFLLGVILTLLATTAAAGVEWLRPMGNQADGVALYGAMIDSPKWVADTIICHLGNGSMEVHTFQGVYEIWDTERQARVLPLLWVNAKDPALKVRKFSRCTEAQIEKALR